MSTLLEAPAGASTDKGRLIGHGTIKVYDADKLRWAMRQNDIAEHEYIDGKPTNENLRKMLDLRHLDPTALREMAEKGALLSMESSIRPSLWVPQHVLERLGLTPDEELDAGYNMFLTAGIARLWANFNTLNSATTIFDATHCRVGVGDGSTAVTAADTDFTGSTNKYWQILDGAPSASTNQTSRTSTFPTGQGNFVWNKWGIDNGTSSGATVTAPLFNAAVAALGTKTSAAAWAFTVTHSIT